MKVLSIERRELSESGQNWKERHFTSYFEMSHEYFKSVLQNNTKLNIAFAEIRSKFHQHCIFQHLDKVLCLLIYYLLYFFSN